MVSFFSVCSALILLALSHECGAFKRGVSPSSQTFPLSLSKERGSGGEVTTCPEERRIKGKGSLINFKRVSPSCTGRTIFLKERGRKRKRGLKPLLDTRIHIELKITTP